MLATAEAKLADAPVRRLPSSWSTDVVAHHALAIVGLALAPLLIFGPGLVNGTVFYGKDTLQFYYPLTEWFITQLKSGAVPLWLPHIFGGYPLFADGEIGMAHPLVLLAGLLFSTETAVTLLRSLHFSLAAILMYWLAVVLGLRPFGAALAGLTFSFGSFLVGHMQHDNILRSAVWLPALLALVELALRARGRARLRYALCGGLVVGVQHLGVHIQPILISLLAAAGWILVGPLGARPPVMLDSSPSGGRGVVHRSLLRRVTALVAARLSSFWILAVMVLVGLSVAAVQFIPLAVFAGLTMRGAGVNYYVSTSYALSPPELLTVLLPYFFRSGPEQHWSLWPPQETTLYVGILPIALAMVAVMFVRGKLVWWLVLGAMVHLWLALGDYATPNPYYWLWNLPGFSVLRAPARFSLVIMLAAGLLAGIGADWLSTRSQRGFGRWSRFGVRVLAMAWIGLLLVLLGIGGALRAALEATPAELMRSIDLSYLMLRREMQQLGAPSVLAGLLASVDLANPSTRLALIWIALTPLALVAWTFPRPWRAGCNALALGLVAADLLSFAGAFYPQARGAALHAQHPAIAELAARNGAHRVLVDPGLNHLIGANQLVHAGVSVAGGYSSLEPARFLDYWWGMVRDENVLLDLFGVRYVVLPRQQLGWMLFNETRFHPAERLVHGSAGNPAGQEDFSGRGMVADRLTVISAVDGAEPIQDGSTVAEVTLIGAHGESRRYGLRYGLELTGLRRGAPNPTNALWAYYGPAFVPNGVSYPIQLSGAVLTIDPPMAIERVEVRSTWPDGALHLHGLGLRDAESLATRTLGSADRTKFRPVYRDQDLVILENRSARPRVSFAPGAEPIPLESTSALDLALSPLDIRNTLVLDTSFRAFARSAAPRTEADVELLGETPNTLTARLRSDVDGFLVISDRYDAGWRAWIDGQEAPVLRANAVLRAVPTPAGEHLVELRYEPWWVTLGLWISLVSTVLVLATLAWLARSPRASSTSA